MSLLQGESRAPKSKKNKSKSIEREPKEESTLKNILSKIIIKKSEERLFTNKEIDALLALSFADNTPFLTMSNKDLLFEFIGGCEKIKRDQESFDDFMQLTRATLTISTGSTYSIIDNAPWFKSEKNYYEKEIRRLKIQITAKRGIFKCPQCLASNRDPTNTETVEIQTRSADEAITNFNNCNNCSYRWKV